MTTAHTIRKARLAAERLLKESETDPAGDPAPPVRRAYFADGLTRYGHPGQCESCGAWRRDGRPPTVHRHRCPEGPDGSQLSAVYDPAAARFAVKPALTPSARTDRAAGKGRKHPR